MSQIPVCENCGQSDEYLMSEDNIYICVCGHQCTSSTSNEVSQTINLYYLNHVKPAFNH